MKKVPQLWVSNIIYARSQLGTENNHAASHELMNRRQIFICDFFVPMWMNQLKSKITQFCFPLLLLFRRQTKQNKAKRIIWTLIVLVGHFDDNFRMQTQKLKVNSKLHDCIICTNSIHLSAKFLIKWMIVHCSMSTLIKCTVKSFKAFKMINCKLFFGL